jgi:predicted HAD superfamily Cof-like phosphohydrolase
MSKTIQEMVKEFHSTYGMPIQIDVPIYSGGGVIPLNVERRKMRLALVVEEFDELLEASGLTVDDENNIIKHWTLDEKNPNIVEMADALGDIVYVCYGMAIEMGFDLDEVISEIHRSNMSKLGVDGKPIYRDDGKVLKGPNYHKPEILNVIGYIKQ